MAHDPYVRIVPGAQTAVLFIHGILSTPRFWDGFTAAMPADVSVVSLLLPGHGGSVTDFGRVRWGEWRRHVQETLAQLQSTHRRVVVVAHSLGTALTVNLLAEGHPPVDALLLIAPPLHIRVQPRAMLHNVLKGVGLAESPEELARYYGTAQDWRVWRYLSWIPRYLELFAECRRARLNWPGIAVPVQAFLSPKDELVSPRTAKVIARCPLATLTPMPTSGHHDFAGDDVRAILDALLPLLGPAF